MKFIDLETFEEDLLTISDSYRGLILCKDHLLTKEEQITCLKRLGEKLRWLSLKIEREAEITDNE